MALRLGVLASGSGTNFQVLAEGAQTGELPVQIAVLIYNNPDAYVAQRAKALGIPAVLLDHRLYQSREALGEQIALTLEAHAVELVVTAGWMRRVTAVLIDRFADRILNVHPSLLPSFRGAKAIEQALDYGVKVTGCSVHIVRLEVDAGPIILQSPVEVREDDTPATLAERIHAQEYRILPEAVRLFAEGRIAIEGNRARLYL